MIKKSQLSIFMYFYPRYLESTDIEKFLLDPFKFEIIRFDCSYLAVYLNSYLTQAHIINNLLREFGKAEMLESYGDSYFKVRVPKIDKSIGFIFGFVEGIKHRSISSIQEYSIG